MDQQTKFLLSRASIELHYENGKSTLTAYREMDARIEEYYQKGLITRREMTDAKARNAEVYSDFYRG